MRESIRVSAVIPVKRRKLYRGWLDSKEHSAFTGAKAHVVSRVGGRFSAWDGYIEGKTLELEAGRKIVQSWRSSDFPAESADSRLVVSFRDVPGGTKITIYHSEIPEGQGKEYKRGWRDFYFSPMKAYFQKRKVK